MNEVLTIAARELSKIVATCRSAMKLQNTVRVRGSKFYRAELPGGSATMASSARESPDAVAVRRIGPGSPVD